MSVWSADVIRALGRDAPDVVGSSGVRWSGGQLSRRVSAAAAWLDRAGAPAGRPVPAILSSTPDALALLIAGAASGRPIAPLSPRLTAHELVAIVAGLPGDLLVGEPVDADLAGAAAGWLGRRLEVMDDLGWRDVAPHNVAGPADPAMVLHTSGTTGRPKPVVVRQDRLAARARHNSALLELGPASRYATASPLHHIAGAGMLAVALSAGAGVELAARFSTAVWKQWAAAGVTHALLVPTMVSDLLEQDELGSSALRMLQYGAAPMPVDVLRRAMTALPDARFVQFYGQTEGSPLTCLTADDHVRAADAETSLLVTVGRAAPGVELSIEAPDAGGVGEVCARAEHVFCPDYDGWLRTGDLGLLDPAGYLHLVGRKGDRLVRGGENVYPVEVETALRAHPLVADIAVVGVPDQRLGQALRAVVVARDSRAAPTIDELVSFARLRLAGYKVPEQWAFVAALPRNATGKVLRRELVNAEPFGQPVHRAELR